VPELTVRPGVDDGFVVSRLGSAERQGFPRSIAARNRVLRLWARERPPGIVHLDSECVLCQSRSTAFGGLAGWWSRLRETATERAAAAYRASDAISSFSSVILWSALSPRLKIQERPTIYGVKVFIQALRYKAGLWLGRARDALPCKPLCRPRLSSRKRGQPFLGVLAALRCSLNIPPTTAGLRAKGVCSHGDHSLATDNYL
jgi:hypothetical protein